MKKLFFIILVVLFSVSISGCSTLQKANRLDDCEEENAMLQATIKSLKKDTKVKEVKVSELEQAKEELEKSLGKEISEYKAKLKMTERGLVISFLAEIFFDSGKDVVRNDAKPVLKKVATVLKENVANSYVAVEGYTDDQPIKRSGWKSNWELSSHRALAVLHYFIDDCDIAPQRLSAIGYGEFRPVAGNDTPANRQKNRRVEVVILPTKISKVKTEPVQ